MAKSTNELKSLLEWLAKDPLNRFDIYDVDKEELIQKCISYEDLNRDYSTAIQYFEQLADKDIKTVQIWKKRKNGNSYKSKGCGLNFALSTNDNVAASGGLALPAATPQQSKPNYGMSGLGNPGNPFGLGAPEILDMRSKSDRYDELRKSYDEIKSENKDLVSENRKLENENLRHQLGIDSKPSAVDKLVEGIANNPGALPQIIASFKGGGSNLGLNAPEPQKLLSDTKSTVVDLISNNQQVQDDHVAASYYVLVEALKGNEKFMDDYSKLLTKHKLIQNGGNDSSFS